MFIMLSCLVSGFSLFPQKEYVMLINLQLGKVPLRMVKTMTMWLCRAGRFGEYDNNFIKENCITARGVILMSLWPILNPSKSCKSISSWQTMRPKWKRPWTRQARFALWKWNGRRQSGRPSLKDKPGRPFRTHNQQIWDWRKSTKPVLSQAIH